MKCENQMELTFPSQSRNESFARAAVAAFAAQLDPNLDEIGDIKTAVSEAVTNCIVHAYRDTIGVISLKCRILPGSVLDIIVKDKGCGIADVTQARTPMYSTGGDDRSGSETSRSGMMLVAGTGTSFVLGLSVLLIVSFLLTFSQLWPEHKIECLFKYLGQREIVAAE